MNHSKKRSLAGAFAVCLVAAAGCKGERDQAEPSEGGDEAAEPESTDDEAAKDEEEPAAAERAETATPGEPAPSFTLTGSDGETYALEDYRGQWVILEWINHGCPFVKKLYGAGKMQELQETYTDPDGAGAAWFSIASSGPGQQGHETPERWNELSEEKGSKATAVLIDESGEVGKRYGARTTPHMYIIDPEGTLVYHGAIDDKPSPDPSDINGAENHVEAVMSAVLAGDEPPYEYRDPYGCSVKYGPAT